MSHHPFYQRVPHWNPVADLRFQARSYRTEMPFHKPDANLRAPIGLRVVLRRVLLECLLYPRSPQFAQCFPKHVDKCRLIVGFQCDSSVARPLDVTNERIPCILRSSTPLTGTTCANTFLLRESRTITTFAAPLPATSNSYWVVTSPVSLMKQ